MDPAPSNSSGPEASLRVLLQESFDCLEREIPRAYWKMCAALADLSVRVRLDDESVIVSFAGAHGRVDTGDGQAGAELRTSRQAVIAVLDGRLSLADAVLTDAVVVKAPLDTLERLNRGIEVYLHGAVRSRSFPALLKRFRGGEQPASGDPTGMARTGTSRSRP